MENQIYFYPNGYDQGFPVNNRKDILNILREKFPNTFMIEIVFDQGIYRVLAIFRGDTSWICVGRTSGNLE
jgi:hypothetical protein